MQYSKKEHKPIILSSCKLKQFHFEVCVPENYFLNDLSVEGKWRWIVKLSVTIISSTEIAPRNFQTAPKPWELCPFRCNYSLEERKYLKIFLPAGRLREVKKNQPVMWSKHSYFKELWNPSGDSFSSVK